MPQVTITLDTEKSYRENVHEMIKLAEFCLDNEDFSLLLSITFDKIGKKKADEFLNAKLTFKSVNGYSKLLETTRNEVNYVEYSM